MIRATRHCLSLLTIRILNTWRVFTTQITKVRIENLIGIIHKQDKLVKNQYEIKKKTFDISIKSTIFDQDMLGKRTSNIEEFFDVIDW